MRGNATIQSIVTIMEDASKNPSMNSEEAQEKILTVISYSALLYSTEKDGQNSHTLHKFINEVILPYVKARDKNNTDVYDICKIVLENWDNQD